MGHTVWSQRVATDIMLDELRSFSKALRGKDREIYEEMLKSPLIHLGSMSYASSMHVWAFILLTVLLEQEKRLRALEDEMADGRIQEQGQGSAVDKETGRRREGSEEIHAHDLHRHSCRRVPEKEQP